MRNGKLLGNVTECWEEMGLSLETSFSKDGFLVMFYIVSFSLFRSAIVVLFL